jgi:hypothetical protein
MVNSDNERKDSTLAEYKNNGKTFYFPSQLIAYMATLKEAFGGGIVLGLVGVVAEFFIGIPFIGYMGIFGLLFLLGFIGSITEGGSSGSDGIKYTHKCPNCGEYWNVNTGMNVIKFSENKYQCESCNSTERI